MSDFANRISPTNAKQPYIVISVDAMGGDKGPSAIVAGVANAAKSNSKVRFIINGDKSKLDPLI